MFRLITLVACLALCDSHAVLPFVPAHTHLDLHAAPIVVAPVSHLHHGVYSHGYGHGFVKPHLHHLWKRSAHYAVPVAPVAVSHQSRVDWHTSPVAAPVVKPLVAPLIHGVPLIHEAPLIHGAHLHKSVLPLPLHYGPGVHYGSPYAHASHY